MSDFLMSNEDREFAAYFSMAEYTVLAKNPSWLLDSTQKCDKVPESPINESLSPVRTRPVSESNDLVRTSPMNEPLSAESTRSVSEYVAATTEESSANLSPVQNPDMVPTNPKKNIHANLSNAMFSFSKKETARILDQDSLPLEIRPILEALSDALPTGKNSMTGFKTFRNLIVSLTSHGKYLIAGILLEFCKKFLERNAKSHFSRSERLSSENLKQQIEAIEVWKIEVSDALVAIEEECPRPQQLRGFIEIILSFVELLYMN